VRLSGRPAIAAAIAALGLAACTSGTPKATPTPHPAPSNPVVSTVAVPGCSAATGTGRQLPAGLTHLSSVPGDPFGVAVTASGRWSFVSLLPNGGRGAIGVFDDTGSGGPRLVRQIPVGGQPLGVALTPDGRYLLAANGSGATVVSVQAAEQGSGNAVLGTLTAGGAGSAGGLGGGAIEVAASPGGRFAFVSLEDSGRIAVFNLQQALASHFRTAGFVGDVPTGIAPVGLAVSPDGDWLYSTSEAASMRALRRAVRSRASVAEGGQGTLAVISMHKAETDPAHATVSTVIAGCSPVRVITSTSGGTVWVTARGSNMLLGFSASRLRGDPAHSLIARVEVGEAPVGLALVDGGQRVVVADSDRFGLQGAKSSLAVVNVAAALAHQPALAGYLPAGGFPRQMALEPDGRVLLVTDFQSQQLETVDAANLP
jgi:DNA-binding beta-propeller fold protein YncE